MNTDSVLVSLYAQDCRRLLFLLQLYREYSRQVSGPDEAQGSGIGLFWETEGSQLRLLLHGLKSAAYMNGFTQQGDLMTAMEAALTPPEAGDPRFFDMAARLESLFEGSEAEAPPSSPEQAGDPAVTDLAARTAADRTGTVWTGRTGAESGHGSADILNTETPGPADRNGTSVPVTGLPAWRIAARLSPRESIPEARRQVLLSFLRNHGVAELLADSGAGGQILIRYHTGLGMDRILSLFNAAGYVDTELHREGGTRATGQASMVCTADERMYRHLAYYRLELMRALGTDQADSLMEGLSAPMVASRIDAGDLGRRLTRYLERRCQERERPLLYCNSEAHALDPGVFYRLEKMLMLLVDNSLAHAKASSGRLTIRLELAGVSQTQLAISYEDSGGWYSSRGADSEGGHGMLPELSGRSLGLGQLCQLAAEFCTDFSTPPGKPGPFRCVWPRECYLIDGELYDSGGGEIRFLPRPALRELSEYSPHRVIITDRGEAYYHHKGTALRLEGFRNEARESYQWILVSSREAAHAAVELLGSGERFLTV